MHTVEGMVTNQARVAMQHEKRVIVARLMVTRKMGTCISRWKRKIQMVKVMSMSRMSLISKGTERTCLFLQKRRLMSNLVLPPVGFNRCGGRPAMHVVSELVASIN
jgi:hypothetical protein